MEARMENLERKMDEVERLLKGKHWTQAGWRSPLRREHRRVEEWDCWRREESQSRVSPLQPPKHRDSVSRHRDRCERRDSYSHHRKERYSPPSARRERSGALLSGGRPPRKPPDLETAAKVVREVGEKMEAAEGQPSCFVEAARRSPPKPPDLDRWPAAGEPPSMENNIEMQKDVHDDGVRVQVIRQCPLKPPDPEPCATASGDPFSAANEAAAQEKKGGHHTHSDVKEQKKIGGAELDLQKMGQVVDLMGQAQT